MTTQNNMNTNPKSCWVILNKDGEVLSEIKPQSLWLLEMKVGSETKPERNGNTVKRIS